MDAALSNVLHVRNQAHSEPTLTTDRHEFYMQQNRQKTSKQRCQSNTAD